MHEQKHQGNIPYRLPEYWTRRASQVVVRLPVDSLFHKRTWLRCPDGLWGRALILIIPGIAEQVLLKDFEEDENEGESNNGHDAAHDHGGLMEKADYVASYPDQVH